MSRQDEIDELSRKLEAQTTALEHACRLAKLGTVPSLASLNSWRHALGIDALPNDFEYE